MIAIKKNVTLADIAKRSEVAVKTASKVFRGDPSVRSYIKERVLKEARKANYTPNTLAQAMRTKKLNLVSFHISEFENPFYGHLFGQIALKLGEHGIMVVPCDGVDKINEANQNAFACATILTDAYPDKVQEVVQSGAVVTINCFDPDKALSAGIYMDFEGSYKEMTQRVLDAGREKVLFLCPSENIFNASLRKFKHIESILKKNGKDFVGTGKKYLVDINKTIEMALNKEVDTVFCSNDMIAVELILKARKLGLKVPDDLLVVGCDGTFPEESLWTIVVDFELFARMTVDLLLKVLRGDGQAKQIKYKPELITPKI